VQVCVACMLMVIWAFGGQACCDMFGTLEYVSFSRVNRLQNNNNRPHSEDHSWCRPHVLNENSIKHLGGHHSPFACRRDPSRHQARMGVLLKVVCNKRGLTQTFVTVAYGGIWWHFRPSFRQAGNATRRHETPRDATVTCAIKQKLLFVKSGKTSRHGGSSVHLRAHETPRNATVILKLLQTTSAQIL
jgi:hypothetical protein